VPLANITWHLMPYDWAWMRDNGPVWVADEAGPIVQDWGFDAWGGLVGRWDRDDAVPCLVADLTGARCDPYPLIHEGGNLEFNGTDVLITNWNVWNDRNPGVTRAELEAVFQEAFGVTRTVWLLSVPADDVTGGHVDGIARFIDADTVVVSRYVDQDHSQAWIYEEAASIVQAAGFEVLRLDIAGPVRYHGVDMDANYVNWLVANGVVIVGAFGNAVWDEAARSTIETFFPGRDVRLADVRELWYWGGGVHCVTNQQPVADLMPPTSGGPAAAVEASCPEPPTVELTWPPARELQSPPVRYDVYRGRDAGFLPDAASRLATGLADTRLVDTDVVCIDQDPRPYFYIVRARDSAAPPNEDANLDRIAVSVLCNPPPPPPDVGARLFVTKTDLLEPVLDWSSYAAPPDLGHYRVYRRLDEAGDLYSHPQDQCVPASWMDTAPDGRILFYKVRAVIDCMGVESTD